MYIWSKTTLEDFIQSEFANNWFRCMNKETFFFNLDIFNWYLPIVRFGNHTNMKELGELRDGMKMRVAVLKE